MHQYATTVAMARLWIGTPRTEKENNRRPMIRSLIALAVVLSSIAAATGAYASDNQCIGTVAGIGAGEGGYCVKINQTGGTCPSASCANRLCQPDTISYHREMVAATMLAAAGGKTLGVGWNNATPCTFINASMIP